MMPTPIGTKRVVYFLDPDLVHDVKLIATDRKCDQSDVVEEALRKLLSKAAQPKLKTRVAATAIA